ncbi:MAG: hypothetical protein NT027_09375 [Proteobacteria bacterium]|nr:hypothetical protein [Pseudomonadota bacterium]
MKLVFTISVILATLTSCRSKLTASLSAASEFEAQVQFDAPCNNDSKNLDVVVGGSKIVEYKYSLSKTQDCSDATYSDWTSIENKISASRSDTSFNTLCVIGRTSSRKAQKTPTALKWGAGSFYEGKENLLTSNLCVESTSAKATSDYVDINWKALDRTGVTYSIFWSTASGVTKASEEIKGVTIPYKHSNRIPWNTYYYRVATVLDGKIVALSTEFFASIKPTIEVSAALSTSSMLCPRTLLTTSTPPSNATQYCVVEGDANSNDCTWTAMPLPGAVRSTKNNATTKFTVFLRDKNQSILMQGAGYSSNDVTLGSSLLPASKNDWLALINSSTVTTDQLKEFNCRIDELTAEQGLRLANIRYSAFTTNTSNDTSVQLNKVVNNTLGLKPAMTIAAAHKALWRLMISTADKSIALSNLDLSAIDLTGRDIGDFDFSGTNIKGAQLNSIDPKSYNFNLSGLNLSGWTPSTTQTLREVNLSGATNIPWSYINATTVSFQSMNLSGLDLTSWLPATTLAVSGINFSNSTNINWTQINANALNFLSNCNFTNVNLSGWNPGANVILNRINFAGATNIPWAALNANTLGFNQINFTGQDMSAWNPISTVNISADFSNATNMPWAALNANTNTYGYQSANFTGVNLSGWNPTNSSIGMQGIILKNATNIPWATLNANSGFGAYLNFDGVNLSGWNPAATRGIGGNKFPGATNIPWAAINSNTNNGCNNCDFSGLDLTSWNPHTSLTTVIGINLSGATSIPWTAINNNTNSAGYQSMNFSGLNLTLWNPASTKNIIGINLTGATNIPWAAINANTHTGGFSTMNFTGLDLSSWNPGTTKNIYGINFTNASNIPWTAVNANTHTSGLYFSDFTGVNLSGWNPATSTRIAGITLTDTTQNIPWAAINANTESLGLSNGVFRNLDLAAWNPSLSTNIWVRLWNCTNIPWNNYSANTISSFVFYYSLNASGLDYTGFDASGRNMYSMFQVGMRGIRSPTDFVEATGIQPSAGTKFFDATFPWGP